MALAAIKAPEAGGPSAMAALTHFDDHDQIASPRYDVELEILQAQVGRDDLKATLG
jgi:hypothetical protein